MNCHQILSGACNAGDRCFSVGSVEGIPFTAYAAGCNIVILASTFERVQIIPGAIHSYIKIYALDCSTDTGKIAAAYENKICIFEPTPISSVEKHHNHLLDYRWVQTGSFISHSNVVSVSWNLEGTRLLTGGSVIQLWKEKSLEISDDEGVKFVIGGSKECKTPTEEINGETQWENIWFCKTAITVYHMAFSPDGMLFATCGRNDRLVKIWYQSKQKHLDEDEKCEDNDLKFTYVYIAHPRAVTNIIWRKTSKYMPKGSVSNMLVTSCLDNISRIWVETVLPDDGLVNMVQFDSLVLKNPKFRTHRHKHKFMQRLKHMKTCFHIRKNAKENFQLQNTSFSSKGQSHIPSLPSTTSVHDFHTFGYHGTGVFQGIHFHLAASINADTDIPLVPSLKVNPTSTSASDSHNNFGLHWLNNKEMHFTLQAEVILQELTKMVIEEEGEANHTPSTANSKNIKKMMENTNNASVNKKPAHTPMSSKSISMDENITQENVNSSRNSNSQNSAANAESMSNATSHNSLNTTQNVLTLNQLIDSLDMKIDCLLRDWHHSPDLLFAIHPIDGSFLIWVVEWLDDYYPGAFRQAQVSFSTRIPFAFPLGDSMSMSPIISLYNTGTYPLAIVNNVKANSDDEYLHSQGNEEQDVYVNSEDNNYGVEDFNDRNDITTTATNHGQSKNKESDNSPFSVNKELKENSKENMLPIVSMVTKHSNGTLNLWQLSFSFKTKFTHVLSIGHANRVSGHRFRVNDIACHPVLPLLLSTSHHNAELHDTKVCNGTNESKTNSPNEKESDIKDKVFSPSGFCSELILWRVDSVGPLCHSGGISELARINSPHLSAFSNVAWIPTLLPSSTLGNYSNSPSACFVASDGENLRVYQAVIDARTLLAEISSSEMMSTLQKANSVTSLYSNPSSLTRISGSLLHEKINVVSQQSTARPGCIIQLDSISDAKHDWQNTQFLHVFQAQLITDSASIGRKPLQNLEFKGNTPNGGCISFEQHSKFKELFYIVIIEKTSKGSTIHMWQIVLYSKQSMSNLNGDFAKMDNLEYLINDSLENCSPGETPYLQITTKKVCTQELPIPEGVDVVHASPAAGHLSSSSIYPACYAPYTIVTICSDSTARFWKCQSNLQSLGSQQYIWSEWNMLSKNKMSTIEIPGQPLNISAAYSGRIACAYKHGKSFTRPNTGGDHDSRYINLCVAIYECESTGGSEWILEDTIHLKNIYLPRMQIEHGIEINPQDVRTLQKKQRLNKVLHSFAVYEEGRVGRGGSGGAVDMTSTNSEYNMKNFTVLLTVPSFSTLQSLRKNIAEHGNTCPLTQKHLVQLDWVSKEEGSHILTVAVGSKVFMYTAVSLDIAQANIKVMKESQSANRPVLRKASSLAQPQFKDDIRWMKLRQINLTTADGLPPLPMQISWVRDGIFVVAMDSEMHVYTQWKPRYWQQKERDDTLDDRNLGDKDLVKIFHSATKTHMKSLTAMPFMSKTMNNLQYCTNEKRKKFQSLSALDTTALETKNPEEYITDFGLFQASHLACPALPQYHPKQLMELLNCGKIRWVKAILAHLVHFLVNMSPKKINDNNETPSKQRTWSRSRTLSISVQNESHFQGEHRGSTTQIPEELMLDYAEITSIPPLPLWILLNTDNDSITGIKNSPSNQKNYDRLFEMNVNEDTLDDLLDNDDEYEMDEKHQNIPKQNTGISYFGPHQGQMLSSLLTHVHLPGLSSLDQMHLLALADTVSTCNTNFSEKFISENSKSLGNEKSGLNGNSLIDSLDDCGIRFLLAMKHYNYLLRCLPLNQRTLYQKNGIGTENIVWAFHSESEEELLNLIPSYQRSDIKWSILRDLGVGYWLRNINILRQCAEKLAKCGYQRKQDPLDAAIYYLAMKKKSIVWGLYRSQRDDKMAQFFSNNFGEDRWRKAALKNAFVLLGKQRFEHAVAFFLLANSLNDAVEVCINKLEDFQLALFIVRLYESDIDTSTNAERSSYKKLLCEYILGSRNESYTNNVCLTKAHPDPFLRSIAYWVLQRYNDSLNTLLANGVGEESIALGENAFLKRESISTNPNVFNFYIYLRSHPLVIRHHLTQYIKEKKVLNIISGFSYAAEGKTLKNDDERQLLMEDTVTFVERQLYFTTAHRHFKAGCPILALEVLNKLPLKIIDSTDMVPDNIDNKLNAPNETGRLRGDSNDFMISETTKWDEPTSKRQDKITTTTTDAFDWSQPVGCQESVTIDDDSKQFQLSLDDDELEKTNDVKNKDKNGNTEEGYNLMQNKESSSDSSDGNVTDIMAQQLKFVACLKILMEELSTLATGFEIDGSNLRYQFYIWLEKEVEALKFLCNYYNSDIKVTQSTVQPHTSRKSTEADDIIYKKEEFTLRMKKIAKRKEWLKNNEVLLRTLLSYCSLLGANGGGLASVKMELILLLQELQQDRSQQMQLFSPLPFPTTLPLLSACVAGSKIVIADPIKYLQSQTVDILQSIIKLSPFSVLEQNSLCETFILRDLAISLSSCIYQSLSGSNSFLQKNGKSIDGFLNETGMDFTTNLCATLENSPLIGTTETYKLEAMQEHDYDGNTAVCTSPSKWPGVTNLRALLSREKDEDMPKLNVLLLESFLATYISMAFYALVTCDSRILYRLVATNLTTEAWFTIFGGGKRTLKLRRNTKEPNNIQLDENSDETLLSITKQRVKLNMKLLGQFASSGSGGTGATDGNNHLLEEKPTYVEEFVPPALPMISYVLSKPKFISDSYDSDDPESDDDEVNDETVSEFNNKEVVDNVEHSNPASISWTILRLAVIKMLLKHVHDFIHVSGIDIHDLPILSPLSHEVVRTLGRWKDIAQKSLNSKNSQWENYITDYFNDSGCIGANSIQTAYKLFFSQNNTPFINGSATGPVRRLWCYLIEQECAQDIFVKILLNKKTLLRRKSMQSEPMGITQEEPSNGQDRVDDVIRIIHKDNEAMVAFCLNNNTSGMIAVANSTEVQELDISLLLDSPNWYEDECYYDMFNIPRDVDTNSNSGFLIVQTFDQLQSGLTGDSISSNRPFSAQSGRGTEIVLKHKIDNVKRMSSHPLLPLYLTGGQDGSVQMWEWGHQQSVCSPRPSGTFAKVTRCKFSEQGNKFGIGDGDGNLSLWQAGIPTQNYRSFFSHQCHNKALADFVFLNSCSLLATAGQSSENKNVIIWDTLLPQRKCCVAAFTCHDQGATCFAFAPQHQILISCGRRGDVCIIDIRQRFLKHRFQAHESAIKCIALDPHEEYFATGSLEGDIKIWRMNQQQYSLITLFPGEHSKSSFFKHTGQGVSQLHIDSFGRLFSCGADGCMKVRQLFDKETIIYSNY